MEDYTPVKDGQHIEETGLQVSLPILNDNTPIEDGQQNKNLEYLEVSDTKEETRSEKLKVETEDDSRDDIRFRRGTKKKSCRSKNQHLLLSTLPL